MASVPRPVPVEGKPEQAKRVVVDFGRKKISWAWILTGWNCFVFFIILGLAGWAFNTQFNGSYLEGNGVTPHLIVFSLIAGVVGMASVVVASHYLYFKREGDKGISASIALVAWFLVMLSFGVACKHIDVSYVREGRLKALAAFDIIIVASHSLFVLVLYEIVNIE